MTPDSAGARWSTTSRFRRMDFLVDRSRQFESNCDLQINVHDCRAECTWHFEIKLPDLISGAKQMVRACPKATGLFPASHLMIQIPGPGKGERVKWSRDLCIDYGPQIFYYYPHLIPPDVQIIITCL